jgi:YidC/Oxa1 family membrane protein insertase
MMTAEAWYEGFYRFISSILAWFYSLIPNVGVAIILLTLIVMVVLTPLTLKSTKSMLQMQRLGPEMKRLQEKHKGDREALNAEMMRFYKENQINPVSGCLPMIAQGPVFIVLYQVLRDLARRGYEAQGLVSDLKGGLGGGIGHVVGQVASGHSFTPWHLFDQPFHPQHLDTSTALFHDLAQKTSTPFLGIDLSLSPSEALSSSGFVAAIPFFVLMILMLVGQVYQNRQIQGRNPNASANPQQQAIMKFLPFILPVFSFGFPAGLSLYYFTQGLCRIVTQHYITHKFYGDNAPPVIDAKSREAEERKVSPGKSGGKSVATTPKKAPAKQEPRKPGSSARSQAAQKKQQSGKSNGSRGAKSGSTSGSARRSGGRRSGEPRGKGSGQKPR